MPSDQTFRNRATFVLLLTTSLGLGLTFLWIGRVIFLLLFASVVGAVFLTAISNWIHERLKVSEGLSLTLFLLGSVAVLGLGIWMQGPNVVQQFALLEVELPNAARHLLAEVATHQWGQWLLRQSPDPEQLSNGFSFALTRIGGIVVSSATVVAGLVIVLSLSIYFAAEPGMYFHGIRRATPARHRAKLDECAVSVRKILRFWVLAKLISMGMVGILITMGLALVGIPLAGSLGMIAAAMTFIPNVGPLLVFAIVFTLEGYLVTPLLERNIVRLPPALTLTMQLLLAAIAGPVGVALAAPLAAAGLGVLAVLVPEERDMGVVEDL